MSTPAKGYDQVTLSIDKKNVITDVGGAWIQSATTAHSLNALQPKKIIGKPIEKFLGGDVTQMYYDALFKICRLKTETITRQYRCDSPSHQRFMQVTLSPRDDNSIDMLHETLKEIPFKNSVTITDIDCQTNHTIKKYIKRCSICNRLLNPATNKWEFPEEINQDAPVDVFVMHTVCPECQKRNWISSYKRS